MRVTPKDDDFSTATKVAPTKIVSCSWGDRRATTSITDGMNLFGLIEYNEYCERVHDELLEEQQTIAESVAPNTGELSTEIGNLDFLQFKSRANAARKSVRTTAPRVLIQCMLGMKTSAIEVIDGLEVEITATLHKLDMLEAEILSWKPKGFEEANAKLSFLCSVMLNGRELDQDQIAFILAECLEKRADTALELARSN